MKGGRSDLTLCASLGEEWTLIKKEYFTKIKTVHPDKGGSAAEFRVVQAAFEGLRDVYNRGAVSSFARSREHSVDQTKCSDAAGRPMPSWDFYAAAAEELVPGYRIEAAKSGRSQCSRCPATIEKGALRVGSMDRVAGSYGRFSCIGCWRVPSRSLISQLSTLYLLYSQLSTLYLLYSQLYLLSTLSSSLL